MATGQTLIQLVASHQTRNDASFRAAVLRLIAEEHQRKHFTIARELERLSEAGAEPPTGREVTRSFQVLPGEPTAARQEDDRHRLLLEIRQPQRNFDDLILTQDLLASLHEDLAEYHQADLLLSYGLRPKRKLLFHGPPGCGKTACAEAFAHEIGLPILYIRFDGLISSYLGETAANLRRIFDYAAKGRWVLFFDEFDAIGKSRDTLGESGELKRVINSFLQMLDSFEGESYFIAATNHEDLLDTALWRRFDDILYFQLPVVAQIAALLRKRLAAFHHLQLDIAAFAEEMCGLSYADVELICQEAMKRSVLRARNNQSGMGMQQDTAESLPSPPKKRPATSRPVRIDNALFRETLDRFQRRLRAIRERQQLATTAPAVSESPNTGI